MTSAPPTPPPRILALDGIRGLAALSILLWHFVPSISSAAPGSAVAYLTKGLGLAWGGVDLFFVLSGYLIGSILLREREARNFYPVFYARRVLRIIPLYYALLILHRVGQAWIAPQWPASAAIWALEIPAWSFWPFLQTCFMALHNTFGSPVLDVTWSVALEEQFYLLLPFLIRWLPPRRLPQLLIPFIVAAPLLRLAAAESMAAYVLLPFRLDSLFLGVLLAWLLSDPVRIRQLVRWRKLMTFALGALLLAAAFELKYGHGMGSLHEAGGWLLHSLLALLSFLLLALVLTGRPAARSVRALSWPPLRWLGTYAYGIYLLHPWALRLVFAAWSGTRPFLTESHGLGQILVAIIVTLLLATASYHWFEQPLLRLGHRLKYRA